MSHIAGSHKLPLPPGVSASAIYGGDADCYRYRLDWTWDDRKPTLCAVMMNPSTATHLNGDRTLGWVHRWCIQNGYGKLIVTNSAAYRCTDQKRLAEVQDPCGPDNAFHVLQGAREAALIVMGYGQPKVAAAKPLGPSIARQLRFNGYKLNAWAECEDGTPKHPLYLPASTGVRPWYPKAV